MRNPLTDIFGVDSNVAVLRELVRHGAALSNSDIQNRSGLSKSSVRLGIISLEQSGIVVSEGSRATKLHRFNETHFLAPQIAALYDAEKNRFTEIIDTVRNSAGDRRSLLKSLWIYGSVARKEDGLESDLDIGLIADKENLLGVVETVRENLREPATRLGFLPNVVGLDLEDVAQLAQQADPWWSTTIQDAVVLVGDRPENVPNHGGSNVHG
ncbi:hypothetical protein C7I85_14805 [Mesorhizobium soli]|uniref:HTH iclR-type domain-containing protein n=1 Tax=Pseudaminobacter soli (ex Li et al. 2025) TaxID=1295366 RepID=A0A2P7SDP4_9HYPH|nr:hypothetical protein C7I85_14805 [Mesorhizobium soli]